jgi:hypothetical protein
VKHFAAVLLSVSLLGFPVSALAVPIQSALAQPSPASSSAFLTIPAGTKIELVVTRPEWAQSAKNGDTIYAETSFPTVAGGAMAIPAGTYIEGTIESVTPPTHKSNRAEIQVLFTKIIFANGYTVVLPGPALPGTVVSGTALPGPVPPGATSAAQIPAVPASGETLMAITIQETTANDLLLDNGAEVEMTLGAALELDAKQVAQSIPLSRAPQPSQFQSATLCRDTPATPGSPGTPDTVIPGSPGTPSTTIPQGPDLPDIVIPGTPATPDTVIPGIPGTPDSPGYTCPARPLVISSILISNQPAQTSQPVAAR